MSKRIVLGLFTAGLMSFSYDAVSQERSFLQRLGFGNETVGLSESEIGSGLREALTVGIEKTIDVVSDKDGYFKNEKIRIKPPKSIQRWDRALRAAGYGDELDEFVLSMNRAAENAAPVAQDIFVDAIASMSIDDAKAILDGSDTAATEYLDEQTREKLAKAFLPQVKKSMAKFEVTEKYREVTGYVSDLPFARGLGEDSVEKYTVDKALDGLFYMLGQEEKRIRENPAARTTDLLKKVFQ